MGRLDGFRDGEASRYTNGLAVFACTPGYNKWLDILEGL